MNKTKRAALAAAGWRPAPPPTFWSSRGGSRLCRDQAGPQPDPSGAPRRAAPLAGGVGQAAQVEPIRVAKMEAADATVSIDFLLRGLFALGATPHDIASALRTRGTSAA